MSHLHAPFTSEQVQVLNQVQTGVRITPDDPAPQPVLCPAPQPVLCPAPRRLHGRLHGDEGGVWGVLVAETAGLRCPHCGYQQDWAPDWAPDWALNPRLARPASEPLYASRSADTRQWALGMLRLVRNRLSRYTDLHQRLGQTPPTATPTPEAAAAQLLVAQMLRNLRCANMALQGVETRPGHVREVHAPWTPVDQEPPQAGQPIELLMQTQDSLQPCEMDNPLHPGFGSSAWVVDGGFYDPLVEQVSPIVLGAPEGVVTHWRPNLARLPESAMEGALMTRVPATPHEVMEWLLDRSGVEVQFSPHNSLADRYTLNAWALIQAMREGSRWVPTQPPDIR